MRHLRATVFVLTILVLPGIARAQLLNGDEHFPIINELRWETSMSDARTLCEQHRVAIETKDSTIIVTIPVLGFASRTELQFTESLKSLKSVQAKFSDASGQLADSVTNYFTRTLRSLPVRTFKEKSLLIFTVRLEMALWKSPTGIVNLVTAKQGNSFLEASLVFFPPDDEKKKGAVNQ